MEGRVDELDAERDELKAEVDTLKRRLGQHDACNGVMGEFGYVPECISMRAEAEKLREAAEQALGSLKSCSGVPHWPALQQAITAIDAALKGPK
jgi:hypothetical protein